MFWSSAHPGRIVRLMSELGSSRLLLGSARRRLSVWPLAPAAPLTAHPEPDSEKFRSVPWPKTWLTTPQTPASSPDDTTYKRKAWICFFCFNSDRLMETFKHSFYLDKNHLYLADPFNLTLRFPLTKKYKCPDERMTWSLCLFPLVPSVPLVEDVPVSVCRPGPGQAAGWLLESSGKLLRQTRDPGPGESPIPWYLGREILCLPLIRTPWAVEVVTRETCDSIRLTLRHQGYLDFNIIGFYFEQTFGLNWLIIDHQ